MRLSVHLHVREIEGWCECDRGGQGNGGSVRDGLGAGEGHRGCDCWGESDGGGIRDGWCAGEGGGSREIPGSPGRICIGLSQDRRGEEGAGDQRKRQDQKSQQAFEHRFDCSLF